MSSDRVAETCEACDRRSSCGGSFFIGGYMAKPFLTYDGQIEKLEKEKNLVISDREYAEFMLKQIGYFGLISGYKELFKNKTTNKYKDGTTFEDIVALYKFDENLRELFLKYILQLERHIRSLASYYFTEKYGERQENYLNSNNYIQNKYYINDISRLIDMLDKLANKNNDYPYINHQRNKHNNVPLWVLFNGVTFGALSKFYALMTQDLKAKVSKNFDSVNEKQLEQFLSVITKFRNVCAHNERLYSYRTKDDIPDTAIHKKLNIARKGTNYIYGKRDLFALVISFRYLLPDNDFVKFVAAFKRILKYYLDSQNSISEDELLHCMGFPLNWQRITRYK